MSDTTPQTPATRAQTQLQGTNDVIRMTMDTVQGFEALQRAANLLSSSTLVPETYRRWNVDKNGNRTENPSGLANCVVALNMASRMGADPLMVAQNMHVIEGRPSWSSVFIIASINQCGRFSPLRFDLSEPGEEVEVEYKYVEWEDGSNGKRRPVDKVGKAKVRHQTCRAWAIEKATGQRLDGPEISIQLALDEGWWQKKGSKWRTMPEVMLRYRAASMFGKLYAPELLMGLQSREELEDITGEVIDAETGEVMTVRTRARVVNPSVPGSHGDAPVKGLGEWTIEQLDELEGLIEEIHTTISGAGFKEQADAFEAKTREDRKKFNPTELLPKLREQAAQLKLNSQNASTEPES